MVNFTRRNLFTRMKLDFGNLASPNSENFTEMAMTTFFVLLGVNKDTAAQPLLVEVKEICQAFTSAFRTKWNSPKVRKHYDRFEKEHKEFLDRNFKVKYFDEPKPKPQEAGTASSSGSQNPPNILPTPTPPPAKKPRVEPVKNEEVPFLEKVSTCNNTIANW